MVFTYEVYKGMSTHVHFGIHYGTPGHLCSGDRWSNFFIFNRNVDNFHQDFCKKCGKRSVYYTDGTKSLKKEYLCCAKIINDVIGNSKNRYFLMPKMS